MWRLCRCKGSNMRRPWGTSSRRLNFWCCISSKNQRVRMSSGVQKPVTKSIHRSNQSFLWAVIAAQMNKKSKDRSEKTYRGRKIRGTCQRVVEGWQLQHLRDYTWCRITITMVARDNNNWTYTSNKCRWWVAIILIEIDQIAVMLWIPIKQRQTDHPWLI